MIRRILAILILAVIGGGWFIGLNGLTIGDNQVIKPVQDHIKLGLDLQGGAYVVLEAQTKETGQALKKTMEQTQFVIEKRVNGLGIAESVVRIEGENKIRVELPGANDPEKALAALGKTAQLTFTDAEGNVVLTGKDIKDATSGVDNTSTSGAWEVNFKLTSEGKEAFAKATQANVGKQIMINLDGKVISAPTVNTPITEGTGSITGDFTSDEAAELAALIRGGALPVELKTVQTSLVGPTLGVDAIQTSVLAGIVGVCLIILYMLIMYRLLGVVASIALSLYILIFMTIISALGVVVTLPGIAGLILSVGMAVDANVIIFARIKEEMALGKSVRVAIKSGFSKAMSTILDSNITTVIAALVLFQFGAGPVKGFATTLIIGIAVSIFTAVTISKIIITSIGDIKIFNNLKLYGVKVDREKKFNFNYVKYRKWFYIGSALILMVGLGFGVIKGYNKGIDFTGGTIVQMNLHEKVNTKEIQKITDKQNLKNVEITSSGADGKEVVIKTSKNLSQDERKALVKSISDTYNLKEKDVLSVEQFGPSAGKELQKNALIASLLAGLGILIYVIIRFELKFGVAAIIATIYDILVLIAFYALFQIPVNTPFIAAILIIMGYSINDTIVVFDRMREHLKRDKRMKPEEIVNVSINQTIVRSLNTSITTLIAITALFVLGVSSIQQFTLPLIVGIISGAYSSIFIAANLWYDFTMWSKNKKRKIKSK